MQQLFNLDSPVIRFLTHLANLMFLTFLWLIFSIPIVTIGASTSALYRCHFLLHNDEGGGVFKEFWNGFRSNFKKGTLLFLILVLPMGAVVFDVMTVMGFFGEQRLFMVALSSISAIALLLPMNYIYALQARFENTIKGTVRNSILLAFAAAPYSLLMLAVKAVPFVMVWFWTETFLRFAVLWLLFGVGLLSWICSLLLGRVFDQYMEDDTESEDESE